MTRPLDTLAGHQTIANIDSGTENLEARCVVIGPDPGGLGLQVLVCDSPGAGAPRVEAMREVHRQRLGRRIFPLVVATINSNEQVWFMGPAIDAAPIGPIPASQAERILQAALNEPTGLQGRQRLAHLVDSVRSTDIAGMTNAGLFATHYLTEGIRAETGWDTAADTARPWLNLRGESLVAAMGYTVKTSTANAHVLTTAGHNQPRAVAVLLNESETFDADSPRFAISPVRFGLNVAQREDAPWLIVLRGSQVRLYAARPGVGVGARGQAETFFELDLALLDESDAAYLTYSFSADGLCDGGLVQRLIEGSERYATGLGERLRQRVYDHVVRSLAVAVANEFDRLGYGDDLALAYRITLRILFRLLFQAYAEDSGLLPYGRNDQYTRNSLKRWAQDMVEQPDMVFDPESEAIWGDLMQVWGVIDTGDAAWDVPAYNGGLFGTDPDLHPGGALIKQLELDNSVIGDALRHLLVDDTIDDSIGAVDFRSLSVREFGTIYEGLLESSLSRADQDLTLDKKSAYVPAKEKDTVVVDAGDIYFHNASGERKATGSYFTPHFAVKHLLERALEPALEQHLAGVAELLDSGDLAGATEKFFDFRVADLAMGSGHFLVSAIDHIEAGMAAFLVDHDLPGITDELRRLETSAKENLGDAAADYEIEPSALLRRQIARRCIYGLDINDVAVELARVAIWIHTFVPGLPMSSLDHNLVQANSLTGIGTIDEAIEALDPSHTAGQLSIYSGPILEALEEAKKLLAAAANASEATKAEVQKSAETYREAREAAEPTRLLFDAAIATRTGISGSLEGLDVDGIRRVAELPDVAAEIADLQPAHMAYLFPEVFLREAPGFDALVGNPPWDKVRHEPQQFWVVRDPGLNALSAKERTSRIEELRRTRTVDFAEEEAEREYRERLTTIARSMYVLQGGGHYDYAKIFTERNMALVRESGSLGLVLPLVVLLLPGWSALRNALLQRGKSVIVECRNTNGWLFPDVHQQFTVALFVSRGDDDRTIELVPGVTSVDLFTSRTAASGEAISIDRLRDSVPDLEVPWYNDSEETAVFMHLAGFPALASGVGWVRGEPDTRWDFSGSGKHKSFATGLATDGAWRVTMARHVDAYGIADDPVRRFIPDIGRLAEAEPASFDDRSSVVSLADEHPCIVYRFPSRNSDSRTLIAAALPSRGWLYSTGYVHGVRLTSASHETTLALLGLINSPIVDWWARRLVDRHVGARIIRALPLPDWDAETRAQVAEDVEGLLAANGQSDIVGSIGVEERSPTAPPDRLVSIDSAVARGFGLRRRDVEVILRDFPNTARGVPDSHRIALLEAVDNDNR